MCNFVHCENGGGTINILEEKRKRHHSSPYLIFQYPAVSYDALEEMFPHVDVHRREGIIQQVDVPVLVHRPRQGDSLLLPAAQVDALARRERKE